LRSDVVDEHLAELLDRLQQRRVLAELAGDECERDSRRGVGRIRGDGFRVLGLPPFDLLDDDEALGAEEPERVRRGDGIGAGGVDAASSSTPSASKRSRSRRSARSIFGRSEPVRR
jgi:hypothetical protein